MTTEIAPTARLAAAAYLVGSIALFLRGKSRQQFSVSQIVIGLILDITAAAGAIYVLPKLFSGIATLLLVNVSCGALLLPARLAFFFASLAAISVLLSAGIITPSGGWVNRATEVGLFGLAYLGAAALCQVLARQARETNLIVEKQEADLASLSKLNDLIIQRMRVGAIVVDPDNQVVQINESAWHLLGNPAHHANSLANIAPELSRRLYHWKQSGSSDSKPVILAAERAAVIPRFVRLGDNDDQTIAIFLDDTSLVSQQAEELTLNSLGRLSASVAHEVRNPLAAISYSAQLLSESEELHESDNRLVEIIRAQCVRMNVIVENILQLSRREHCKPELFDLGKWVEQFVEEYRSLNVLGADELRHIVQNGLMATFDPSHLQQVAWNLVQNALRYGRLPESAARVVVTARRLPADNSIVFEVIDRGPGIPPRVAEKIFNPFFTTNEDGTGLGLYIARQICETNQTTLDYLPVAGGGSCFRISFGAIRSQ